MNSIVANLHLNGELDEQKLRIAQQQFRKGLKLFVGAWFTLLTLKIMSGNGEDGWLFFLIYSVLGYVFYKQVRSKAIDQKILLYTVGLRILADVKSVKVYKKLHVETITRIFSPGLLIEYNFKDENGMLQRGEYLIIESEITKSRLGRIKAGEKINVLYLPNESFVNTIDFQHYNHIFNIRK